MDKTAKAPVTPIRQTTQYTCMATSMCMALRAYGLDVTEAMVNKVMGAAPMQGATWEQAIGCAQHFGMQAMLVVPASVPDLKRWTDLGFPVMISWNPEGRPWSHASVVFDVDGNMVHVADPNVPDPEQTTRVVPTEDFYKKWYEDAGHYLVRRIALVIMREVTPEGKQAYPVREQFEALLANRKLVRTAATGTPYHPHPAGSLTAKVGIVHRINVLGASPGQPHESVYTVRIDQTDYAVTGPLPRGMGLGSRVDFLAGRNDPVYGLPSANDIVVVRDVVSDTPSMKTEGGHSLVNRAFLDHARKAFPDTSLPNSPRGGLTIVTDDSATGDVYLSPERDQSGWFRVIGKPGPVAVVMRGVGPMKKVASTGLECRFWKANDHKWYMALEQYSSRDEYDYFGPFDSFEQADKFLGDNFANPGGYSMDDSGRRPPPKSPFNPRGPRRWASRCSFDTSRRVAARWLASRGPPSPSR